MNLAALQDFESYLHFLAATQLRKLKLGLWEPQDIVQETLVRAVKNSSQYRGRSDAELAAWLRQILSNYLRDLARRSGRQLDLQALNTELEHSSHRLESWLACERPTPRRHTLQRESWNRIHQSLQKLPLAQRQVLAALELQRQLAEQAIHERRFQSDLAYTLDNLGVVKDRQAEMRMAADYIAQSVALRRDLLQTTPGEETLHRALTQSYLNLASLLKRQPDWAQHRDTLQQTVELVQQAQSRFPSIVEYRYWMWVAQLGLAENHSQAGEYELALDLLNKIIPSIEAAPVDSNSSRILRNQLLRAFNARAPILSEQGKHAAALADWQSCIDQTRGAEQSIHRLCQAVAYVKAQQSERAVEIVEAVLQEHPAEPATELELPQWASLHYKVACVRALMVNQTDDLNQRQLLLNQATDAVQASLKHGWKPIWALRQDPDLQELQSHAPFQSLLDESEPSR